MDTTTPYPWTDTARAKHPTRVALIDAWAELAASLEGMRVAMGDAKPPGYNRLHSAAWMRTHRQPEGYAYVEEATLLSASAHQKLAYKAAVSASERAAEQLAQALERHPSIQGKAILHATFNAEKTIFGIDIQHVPYARGSQKAVLERLLALDRVLEALPAHNGRVFLVDTHTVPAGSVDAAIVLWLALTKSGRPKIDPHDALPRGNRGQDLKVSEHIPLDDTVAETLQGWAQRLDWLA